MTDYVKRPKPDHKKSAVAAVYQPGQPLDDLRKVARRADPDAQVVEVPEWGVLLVRHEEIPDPRPRVHRLRRCPARPAAHLVGRVVRALRG